MQPNVIITGNVLTSTNSVGAPSVAPGLVVTGIVATGGKGDKGDVGPPATSLVSLPTQTSSFTAVAGNYYPVDTTSGNITVALPTSSAGQELSIKKTDASVNTVTLSGTINGVSATTLLLKLQNEGKVLTPDGSGGWNIYATNLGLAALDARYQATLTSGTTIKTINGTSLLGSGDLVVTGGGGSASNATTTAPGLVQLAGDLSGTATSPTVPGLAGKQATISATGILKGAGSGSVSSAIAGDFPTLNQNTTGTASSITGSITESQVTNLTTDLAAKAPLASPTFTGTPAAPTATGGTNTTQIATTAFVTSAVSTAVTGVLTFKGSTDASTSPNYPAANKGDVYVVSVAGKIGGASGVSVDVGDQYFATANNAGGTQAAVGASWDILEHNLVGALLSANNLSDVASAATARTNLGLGTLATLNSASLTSNVTGTLPVANGGTGVTTSTGTGNTVLSTSPTLTSPKADFLTDTNGGKEIELVATASSANWLRLTNTLTGNGLTVGVNGTGANENLTLAALGTGTVQVGGSQVTTAANTQTLTNKSISGSQITSAVANATTAANLTGSITESQVTNLTADLAAKLSNITGLITAGTNVTITGSGTSASPYIIAAAGGGTGGMSNPMTTLGDIIYEDGTPTAVRLAGNTTTTKKFLTQAGNGTTSAAPAWGTLAASDVPTLNQNTTGTAANVTGTVAIANGGTGLTTLPSGLLKGAGTGTITAAVADTDYTTPTGTETLTNKRITNRVSSTTSSATPSISTDSFDVLILTAQAAAITSFTLSGTPTDAQKLLIRIKATGAFAIAAPTNVQSSGVASFPTTTVSGKTITSQLIYDATAAKWVVMATDSVGY